MSVPWIKPEELVEFEFRQAEEEGRDVSAFAQEWAAYRERHPEEGKLREKAESLMALMDKEVPDDNPAEPSDFPGIAAASAQVKTALRWEGTSDELRNRILGGWLGRAAGCLLGKPVEGRPREWIREILEASGNWPLDDYFTAQGVPEELLQRFGWHKSSQESLQETIECMPEDDDMNYPMLNLMAAEKYGPEFAPWDVLQEWLVNLPVMQVFTAERMAYYNALRQLEPPHTARFQNPYREWIGAQIRADLWGWICPGNPGLAAELAYRDAAVSHVKNGIYGEIFIAAAIAASFVVDTAAEAIRIGLEYIPQSSRLAEAIREVFRMYEEIRDFESAVDRLYELYGRYHWVHTINNAALVTAALLYSKGDYERGITYAVAGGWDTDCNGATVGSILGVIHGADRLPEKWIAPLRNTIRTSLRGFDRTTFPELAARTVTLAQRFSLDRR